MVLLSQLPCIHIKWSSYIQAQILLKNVTEERTQVHEEISGGQAQRGIDTVAKPDF